MSRSKTSTLHDLFRHVRALAVPWAIARAHAHAAPPRKCADRAVRHAIVPIIENLEGRQLYSTTFNVTNDQDAGAGTLRQAIELANATQGPDRITFSIGNGGIETITPNTPLPDITDTLEIDGTTQPPLLGAPNIELSGDNLASGSGTEGLRFVAGSQGSVVKGLLINRFEAAGIEIRDTSNVTVAGNWIGVTADGGGFFIKPQVNGVRVVNSNGNTIGGTNIADRNIISGNVNGIVIDGEPATGNVIAGNFIGTSSDGTLSVRNALDGVIVLNGASGNTVGGTSAGARNVIAGNDRNGILLADAAHDNIVQGNFIGVDVSGETGLANGQVGVLLSLHADHNTIGDAAAGAGNVISGNGLDGVTIVASDGAIVQGNFIGTNPAGTTKIPNVGNGINLNGSVDGLIGGVAPGAGNLVSGNQQTGIVVVGATRTIVQGNRVGTDVTGTAALGNTLDGVRLISGSDNNTIGGDEATGAGNIISGNGNDGIAIAQDSDKNNIHGNRIGTDFSGTHAIANGFGVHITLDSDANRIGDSIAGLGNLISGNRRDGVFIELGTANFLFSNRIGTNAAGSIELPNSANGVHVLESDGTIIGGGGGGNLISGNGNRGILIERSPNTFVRGNRIGTDATGVIAIGNVQGGIALEDAFQTSVGGTAAGQGNLISGNANDGIAIRGDSIENKIQGNLIGTNAVGTARLGNIGHGILINGAAAKSNIIGGTDAGAGNVIAANTESGVTLLNPTSFNVIQGNKIGTDVTGTLNLGNRTEGVLLADATFTLVGGTVPEAGNIIAFNGLGGVVVSVGNNNPIRYNSIFGNGKIGIDLGGDGITPNDSGDVDVLSNNRQNFPVLLSAVATDGKLSLKGAINSTPNKVFVLDIYANSELDGVGGAQGRAFVGSMTVVTDATGNALFDENLAASVAPGQFITATANTIDTDPFADTSEFSSPRKVTGPVIPPPPPLPPVPAPAPALSIGDASIVEGNYGTKSMTFTITRSGADLGGASSVTVATANGTATAGYDYVALAPKLISFAAGETSKTLSIVIKGDTAVEALNETLFVNLSGATGATIADGQGVGTIVDDEARLKVYGRNVKASKRTFSGVIATFTSVDFTKASDFVAEVNWGDGTKSAGSIAFNATTKVWEVTASHKYAKGGNFATKSIVTDANGASAFGNGNVNA